MQEQIEKVCDIIFEGGGIRGIGLVGAVSALEQNGYKFRKLAGSSAGAIVASLLSAGYTSKELHEIMSKLDFEKFKQTNFWHNFGRVGKAISATRNFGVYSAQAFEDWLANLLAQKNVFTFADLNGQLKITASDVTDSTILVLPDDLVRFGINPDSFSVATAVRMSMSIPIFYEPYELRDANGKLHFIVDGGLLSNYPIWIFDDGISIPEYPILGLRFARSARQAKTRPPRFREFLMQIITATLDSNDEIFHARNYGDTERTIHISTIAGDRNIRTTDFDITNSQTNALFNNGYDAGNNFIKAWNFSNWKNKFRGLCLG